MNLLEAYTKWDQKIYERHFYQPIYKSVWFGVTTLLFLAAFARALQMLFRYGPSAPLMQLALLGSVIGTPLLWIILLKQHRNVRRLVSQGTGLKPEAEKRLLREVASASLFLGWFAYALIGMAYSLVWRLLGRM